jgi:hypothetical protein
MTSPPRNPSASKVPAAALLAEHYADWLGAVARRRSRRAFDGVRVGEDYLASLEWFSDTWRPYPSARAVLVRTPAEDIFTGIIGGYGKVTGSPHLLLFVADSQADFADQHAGYTGEAVILEATRLGLDTCWVGGFFNAAKVARLTALTLHERVVSVSPLGYALVSASATERAMQGLAGAHKRKPVEKLAPAIHRGDWPQWAIAAVETSRLAPSAMNRQPWRFRFENGGLVLSKDNAIETPKVTKRLDGGIAMLHVELAAAAHGVRGTWTDLNGMDVARFDPKAT